MSAPLFKFTQLDLASGYGLEPGRYPVRSGGDSEADPDAVLVVELVDAPFGRPRRRRTRRSRAVTPEDATPMMSIHRATIVRAEPLADKAQAAGWLSSMAADEEGAGRLVGDALTVLNRALHAQRASAQDPYVPDVSREHALALRIGYGSGDAVASGRWSEALDLPRSEPRRRRIDALRPQERVARVLGGRETVDVCEGLLLRARADLDAGRRREAALELRSGVEALLVELAGTGGQEQAADLAELEAGRERLAAIAREALRDEPARDELSQALLVAERAIRRRRILGG